MTGFVNYRTKPHSNISDSTEVLLTAEYVSEIVSINICNVSNESIWVNLKINRLLSDPIQDSFYLRRVELLENQSRDLMSLLEKCRLEDGDSLLIYSDGYTQVFDCIISYDELNELNAVI